MKKRIRKKTGRPKIVFTRSDIIKAMRKENEQNCEDNYEQPYYQYVYNDVLELFESVIGRMIAQADKSHDVGIRPWTGFRLYGTYQPETRRNTAFGPNILIREKINPHARFTQTYRQQLNASAE